ncbi:MAG: c-type cytochrome [Gammaproteobacteria bacterium]|nr:c-type cytochrome [Gammaproteobacteria bacterium]MDH3560171.1 c-type cytochrome [Gammaproteobacteria bacterium]
MPALFHFPIPLQAAIRCTLLALVLVTGNPLVAQQPHQDPSAVDIQEQGKTVYNFYCYQCHSYAGDARTLASSFLEPKPRNFSATDPDTLNREQMIEAVTHGRPGTAMTSFSSVLNLDEISATVDYIRTMFMQGSTPELIYHTPENGWDDHERYRYAFPFASGEIPLDTAWENLTPEQRHGKQLFMHSCISCHDRGRVTNEGAIWELRALSYPRKHYTHTRPMDGLTGASPYALHDKPPEVESLTANERRGEQLYQQNCAFCHAADGTARNWIGSFLEPRPRNLTGQQLAGMDNSRLKDVIMDGIEGTSMPAWRHVLDAGQIEDILDYIQRVFRQADKTDKP